MIRFFAVFVFLTICHGTAAGEIRNIFDARVPMRDGVELSADIWLPTTKENYPAILIRTPYGKASGRMLPFVRHLSKQGYAVLLQDVRGRGDSDGTFLAGGEGNDGYDSVEWIATQAWSNGDICTMGGSYLAAVQWAAAREKPPHLRCMAATANGGMHDLMYIGGAVSMFMVQWTNIASGRMDQRAVAATLDWNKIVGHRPLLTLDENMGRPMPLYRRVLTTRDPQYDFVKETRLDADDYRLIDLPVLHVTGWFDITLSGTAGSWSGMAEHSPAKDKQFLLIGPWDHEQTVLTGGANHMSEMKFTPEATTDLIDLHTRFFDHYLKKTTKVFDAPRARVYVTGSNQWRNFAAYPPKLSSEQRLYLHSDGRANSLAGDGSLNWEAPGVEPTDTFVFDPRKPVPVSVEKMQPAEDQRPIEERDDVLVYTGEVLEESLEIIGTVSVELYAGSDAKDTDFTAKLIDVYPDGRAVRLGPLNSGVIRARFRNGFGSEELLTPGEVEKYKISLFEIAHTFLPGHRVRLEISSSAYPQILPNQNTGNPIETDTQWRLARQTIYHDDVYASAVILPVFSKATTQKDQ
jgi:hypothetical protein|tara:strand:- start:1543 stop:3273 length:1731 start_codon:yes stop_codon:yes gene_type:complete